MRMKRLREKQRALLLRTSHGARTIFFGYRTCRIHMFELCSDVTHYARLCYMFG